MATKGSVLTQRRKGAEKVRLEEVCSASTSQVRQKDLDNNLGPYPIYGASGIIKYIDFYQIESEGLGIVKDGAGVGRVMRLPPFSSVIGTVMIVRPQAGADSGYLYYALSKQNLGALYSGAAIPHLYFKDFKDRKINLPHLPEQKRIAAVLDKICELKKNAEAQIENLDLLVKSRFVEMFGDVMTNPNKWPMAKIGDYLEFLTSGSRGWAKYFSDEGELFITIKNVKGGRVSIDDVQHVKPPTGAETERTRVQEGDLLISITADLGRTGIVTRNLADQGAYINQHLSCVRLDRKSVESLFVAFYLESTAGKAQFEKKNQSAVKAGLNFEAIRSLRFYLPPLALQQKFAAFVEKVEKLKDVAKKSVEEMDTLYRAKLQEYFG